VNTHWYNTTTIIAYSPCTLKLLYLRREIPLTVQYWEQASAKVKKYEEKGQQRLPRNTCGPKKRYVEVGIYGQAYHERKRANPHKQVKLERLPHTPRSWKTNPERHLVCGVDEGVNCEHYITSALGCTLLAHEFEPFAVGY
jgi:hypothetical protein